MKHQLQLVKIIKELDIFNNEQFIIKNIEFDKENPLEINIDGQTVDQADPITKLVITQTSCIGMKHYKDIKDKKNTTQSETLLSRHIH